MSFLRHHIYRCAPGSWRAAFSYMLQQRRYTYERNGIVATLLPMLSYARYRRYVHRRCRQSMSTARLLYISPRELPRLSPSSCRLRQVVPRSIDAHSRPIGRIDGRFASGPTEMRRLPVEEPAVINRQAADATALNVAGRVAGGRWRRGERQQWREWWTMPSPFYRRCSGIMSAIIGGMARIACRAMIRLPLPASPVIEGRDNMRHRAPSVHMSSHCQSNREASLSASRHRWAGMTSAARWRRFAVEERRREERAEECRVDVFA